ncbi:uncharacterized protein EV420DRAFT_1038279 [Desarmillaria tabescens]|uniref:Uncharacterized protein n=1 Tax=Armillaria tabescens TaxID=1929756 RepID=A0AA39NF81_ARMTA|nr:uncharacterized protein EV420DRAFT_1038279 [Desarmillaria tabescens]KAK0464363.1 hypothetical protein EV420DRAFT_1038279 [Desarmillaria tabescens]
MTSAHTLLTYAVMSNNRGERGSWRGRATRSVTGNLRRPMEYIPSVSRSSGLDKDGDVLKDFKVQEEYREFIQEKLNDVWKRFILGDNQTEKQRTDAQENILILFRKLREGIYACGRKDGFALEAYETSFHLAILFNVHRQIGSIIPHLFVDLLPANVSDEKDPSVTILVCLLYHLVAEYPSQITYRHFLDSLPSVFKFKDTPAHAWIKNLSQSIRTRNYVHFESLTRQSALVGLVGDRCSDPAAIQHVEHLAFYSLVDSLHSRNRSTTWTVLRSAYRELSSHPESETRAWLTRTLVLHLVASSKVVTDLDGWLESESLLGHIRRKEGIDGRWIVCKVQ